MPATGGRHRLSRRTKIATAALGLAIAAGALVIATTVGDPGAANAAGAASPGQITCPDVASRLPAIPASAQAEVQRNLDLLNTQISEANNRLVSTVGQGGPNFVQNAILGPLKDKRAAVINRIEIDFRRVGATAPDGLDALATCSATPATQDQTNAGGTEDGQDQNGDGQDQGDTGDTGDNGDDTGQQDGNGGQAGNGPVAADFVDITTVQPNVQAKTRKTRNASTGTFTTKCGVNQNKNHNTDNVIVAPGVTNGAHHLHDYVGNQKIDAFSSNDTFLQGGTSCQDKNDLSAYYWPVVRVQDGTQDFDQNADGGGKEGNVGRILVAKQAQIKYVGNPTSKVVAMPQFLRVITGDAKAFTNGTANANAHWSCTGFENKVQLTDKYPICPNGSDVVRTFAFQSCWDGQNTDSANHRTHVAFADASGRCQNGFRAIPQLTMRLVYSVPRPVVQNGQVKNAYAVDGFPEQLHKAITDHDDFIAVTKGGLANKIASCLNSGRMC
jgi:hypothetical protein